MPRLEEGMEQHRIGGSNFTFQGTRIDRLGATEYTLVTIAIDVTGSTSNFADELREALIAAVRSCKKSPRADYLMIRVILFSSSIGVREIHGFKELADIDPNAYAAFKPDGFTPLYDAAYSGIGAMVDYGAHLMENDYLTNGIIFIITDGGDNDSKTASPAMIRQKLEEVKLEEKLESLVSILIGVNARQAKSLLEDFQREAGIGKYIDLEDASEGSLAKLAEFVSRSVSSQSQAVGTGGPSQNISAVI
ncbi:MAG: hypothetical protein HGA31_00210 [Candidatus Moranbacteria bacterium]|nr:hypothetical protein [Candidatus Moranbacteria bacterium]